MFLFAMVLLLLTGAMAGGFGFWVYRVASHLRGDEEATRAVVRHVLMPLFERKSSPDEPPGPPGGAA